MMNYRRYFIKLILSGIAGLALIFSPLTTAIRLVWARAKKIILPEGYYGGVWLKYVYKITAHK